jgi:uncharacterized protein YndB with AHSA1/START domain
MSKGPAQPRTDTGSRVIKASPRDLYRAMLDRQAVAAWRPPQGMTAEIYAFEPWEGGTYRMAFVYAGADHAVRGKTSEHADVFSGRFMELVPDARIVERVEFESDDPAFAGAMTVTTSLAPVPGGTRVTIVCENVPPGVRPSDHQAGMASTLQNLAAFTE